MALIKLCLLRMSVIHNVPYVSFSEGPKLAERESVPIPVTVPHSTSLCVGRTAKRTERSATPTVCKYCLAYKGS